MLPKLRVPHLLAADWYHSLDLQALGHQDKRVASESRVTSEASPPINANLLGYNPADLHSLFTASR